MKMEINKEMIRELRTVLLPRYLGVDRIPQRKFGMILEAFARETTGFEIKCSLASVQNWEYGISLPLEQVTRKTILDIYEKTKKAKVAKETEKIAHRYEEFRDNECGRIVEQLTS